MRIVHQPTGREATPRTSKGEGGATYKAFPPGSNKIDVSKSFPSVLELAVFLLRNPDWKVWVAGLGHIDDGQVNGGLVIEGKFDLDELKAKKFI